VSIPGRFRKEADVAANQLPDQTRLAVERTRLAYERTLMAWIRTSISLIGFGFTIYKFFQYLRDQQADQVHRLIGPRTYSMLMIGVGLFTLLLAPYSTGET
jgi:putative membrane protein